MTLTDNLAVSMRENYADQSSSTSSSSDSDDDISSTSSSSSHSSLQSTTSTKQRMKRLEEKSSEGGDHNGELSTKPQSAVKKRTTPVKRAATVAAGNKPHATKKQKIVSTIAPPSPPPPPPLSPPPQPPSSHFSDSSSSSSSSLLSSDSLSSSDSDDDVVDTAQLLPLPPTSRANGTATKSDNALQVRLKIPQGFVSNQPKNSTDKGNQIQAKKQRTTKEGARTVKRSKNGNAGTVASTQALPTQSQAKEVVGSTEGHSAGAGSFQTIPSKLIPSGPTIPLNDVRGKKELAVSKRTDGADPTTVIDEVDEVNIPNEFNDPFAVEAEALRNLDLFYFCDAHGHPIGLDILERPKEERPRIMGFGTVVQHLSPPERPVPVKILLPSPAFPSRKRARPVNGFTKSSSVGGRKRKSIGKNSESQSAMLDSVPQRARRAATLDRHYVASDGSASDIDSNMRFNHESESDTNTGSVSHHSRQGDGSDESDTSSRRERTPLKWSGSQSSGSDDERRKSRKGKKLKRKTKQSTTKSKATNQRSLARPPTITTNNPDVNELVRSDREGIVAPNGTTQDELNLLECGFRHPQEYKRLRVFLPEITDWCLDYTDGDPTLWVITPHAWYKIAGPLSGMLPHPSYRGTFEHVRKLFEASYLVAYVLKEWLPINRKVAYRSTLLQIVELSLHGRYPVSAWFLMTNYPFIQHQITDLVADKEMYKESMFFRQLERWHEGHHLREKRTRKEKLVKEERRVQREEERLKRRLDTEEERRVKDEERKQKEVERRYPMEDLELWDEVECDEEELDESEKEPTRRKKFQFPLDCNITKWHGLDGYLLGNVIMVWQALSTFKSFIGMESMTLESLAECLVLNNSESIGATNFTLVRVFMAFLKVILSEKSYISPIDDVVVEGSTTVADLFGKGTTKRTYGIGERPYRQSLSPLTWQEILRQLMAKDMRLDASIGPIEPLVGCETVRQYLYMQNNSVPFNTPVDTKQKGLEDYVQVIKKPMDLGTIKQKLESGVYEEEMNGYEVFAADVRLIWENAILYNTEHSDVGRAALALAEVFEQQYERLVTDRLAANKERLATCERVAKTLLVQVPDVSVLPTVADIVHGFSTFEFYQLPLPYKVGAMSWLCSEFLKLDSVRSLLEAHAEQEFEILREHRKRLSDVESRRKALDRKRKEKEAIFRQERIDEGIPINANNHFSEATRNEYPHIKAFYQELQAEKIADEAVYDGERKAVELELAKRLEGVKVRELPLGKDRFHNNYWVFTNDTYKRLFIEMNESGTFMLCTREDIEKLLRWLNPKGIRENELLRRLIDIKDDLVNACSNVLTHTPMNVQSSLTLILFPMTSDGVIPLQPEDTIILDNNISISNDQLVKRMLLRTHEQLRKCKSAETTDCTWRQRVTDASSREQLGAMLAELEEKITTSRGAGDTIRTSWKRKRREWSMALKGAHTMSQIVFLLHVLLAECINIDAFMDLSVRLDRKEWLKLRSKECRNFIPELEKHVVYFGDGHAQALKEDAKRKNKKVFTRKSDPPRVDTTCICAVSDISYYHGGGDPYALLVLETVDVDTKTMLALSRDPRSHLCPEPSPLERLARILLRIVTKVKLHSDAEPFLEPVSNRDYPEYKEIILQPMDLTSITNKAKTNTYKRVDVFLEDFKLIASNCELFCEGRFPALPPRARALVELAEGLVKKSLKEIRVCEALIGQGTDTVKEIESDEVEFDTKLEVKENGDKPHDTNNLPKELTVMIRLENRLPEFLVDTKRYEQAITRTWRCGEKFRILFRDQQGLPGEYYGGITAGSLPFDADGLLPWEALRVVWDEDDGSDDSRINPWEAELISESRKTR